MGLPFNTGINSIDTSTPETSIWAPTGRVAQEVGGQLRVHHLGDCGPLQDTLKEGRAFYAYFKRRMRVIGRNLEHLKILPGAFVVVGDYEGVSSAVPRAPVPPNFPAASISVWLLPRTLALEP